MKYGESTFDIIYLLIAIISGFLILKFNHNKTEKKMGLAVLILGFGDAFHLIPRVLNYFIDYDFSLYLGIGKLITSITMTVFYIFMYYICIEHYAIEENKKITISLFVLTFLRIAICLLPQNGWISNQSPLIFAILRNIPFVIIGVIICCLYFKNRNNGKYLKFIWLYIALSFAFYMPVAIGAGFIKILGMLMLPKTICYILIIFAFLKVVINNEKVEG